MAFRHHFYRTHFFYLSYTNQSKDFVQDSFSVHRSGVTRHVRTFSSMVLFHARLEAKQIYWRHSKFSKLVRTRFKNRKNHFLVAKPKKRRSFCIMLIDNLNIPNRETILVMRIAKTHFYFRIKFLYPNNRKDAYRYLYIY